MKNEYEKNVEELLRSAYLELDFEDPKNEKLLAATAGSVFSSTPKGGISLPSKSTHLSWLKWGGAFLVLAILVTSVVYQGTPSNKAVYQPVEIQLPSLSLNGVKDLFYWKMKKNDLRSILVTNELPQPKSTKRKNYQVALEQEDTVKKYHPEAETENFKQLTVEEVLENNKLKEKLLKDIVKVNKDRVSEIKVFAQSIHEDEKSLTDFILWNKEVTNQEYNIFLKDLIIRNKIEEYERAKVYNDGWVEFSEKSYMEPMANMYSWHPAYNDYPVVNISREGAELFCEWLTKELEKDGRDKYGLYKVRIPTSREWEYAASSGQKYREYPWGNGGATNAKDCYLANFMPGENNYVDDGGLMTVHAGSYAPNDFGLFNVSGNVAEMVSYDNNSIGARGGSWSDSLELIKIYGKDPYLGISSPLPTIGFRPVITYRVPRINGSYSLEPISNIYLTEEQKQENEKRKYDMIREVIKLNNEAYSNLILGSMELHNETITLSPFYIKKHEITNIEYKTFLYDLIVQGRLEELEIAKPNSNLWKDKVVRGKFYARDYFSHKAYNNYPVVNISREAAELFCKWLFNEVKKADVKSKTKSLKAMRIPRYEEWMYVASSGGRYKTFPWEGSTTMSEKKKFKDFPMANYKMTREELKQVTKYKKPEITNIVSAYWPNAYGVYSLAGNVEEMVKYKDEEYGAKGGSWNSTEEEIMIYANDQYKGKLNAGPTVGFRIVLEVKEKLSEP